MLRIIVCVTIYHCKKKPITIYNKIKSTVQRIDLFFSQRNTQIKIERWVYDSQNMMRAHFLCTFFFIGGWKKMLEIDFTCMFMCNLSIKWITNYSTIFTLGWHIYKRDFFYCTVFFFFIANTIDFRFSIINYFLSRPISLSNEQILRLQWIFDSYLPFTDMINRCNVLNEKFYGFV